MFKLYQPNISWKSSSNMSNIIIAKNINNSISINPDSNIKINYGKKPIPHYRKQLISDKNGYSKQSMIGSFNKPTEPIISHNNLNTICNQTNTNQLGFSYILTDYDIYPNLNDYSFDISLNRMVCTACNPQTQIIKSANTNLDTNYSSSYNQYMKKKCETYIQNLPLNKNNINNNCQFNNCNVIFKPSNIKYQTQGPITSSAKITALKYGCIDSKNIRCILPITYTYSSPINYSKSCCLLNPQKSISNIYIMNGG